MEFARTMLRKQRTKAVAFLPIAFELFGCAHAEQSVADPSTERTDEMAVAHALQTVDADECYFLPPAGPIRFRVEVSSSGAVESVRPDDGTQEGAAVDCIAAALRRLRMRPFPGNLTLYTDVPHAADLRSATRRFDRKALQVAIAEIDLAECAEWPGPRSGEAILVTSPRGDVVHAYVRGPRAGKSLGTCVERNIVRAHFSAYNGGQNWVLVTYSVPNQSVRP
jgi:hypothetical protein